MNTVTHGQSISPRAFAQLLGWTPADISERYYIDPGESIRFRVDSVDWNDIRPAPPPQYNAAGDLESSQPEKDPIDKAGFKIFVSYLLVHAHGLQLITRHRLLNQVLGL